MQERSQRLVVSSVLGLIRSEMLNARIESIADRHWAASIMLLRRSLGVLPVGSGLPEWLHACT